MYQNIIIENNRNQAVSEKAAKSDDKTVGQKLLQARLESGKLDIEDISRDLCIRPHFLSALEQDNFNKFPSACYAAGFLKNYATYLGLNADQITSQYKKEFNGSEKKVDLVFLEVPSSSHAFQQKIVSLVILTALVLYGVWYSMSGKNNLLLVSLPDITEVTSNIMVMAAPTDIDTEEKFSPKKEVVAEDLKKEDFIFVQQVNATALPLQAKTTAVVADQVRLIARQDSWVRIVTADSKILVDRVLLAGEDINMTHRAGLKLMTSNAGGLSIYRGDIETISLGKVGEIRNNISLDKEDLFFKTAQLSQ